ncbi:hypothetical protein L596_010513 [Steinernema carpocapsae]|nr:hypothetical protein L596_010513 [Steinernema carpocapsae]
MGRMTPRRAVRLTDLLFYLTVAAIGVISGFALYYRTTNVWNLKNLGDTFLTKHIGRRPIIIGAFHRQLHEQNVGGHYAVFQFLGNGRESYSLYCLSKDDNGKEVIDRAQIERIHKGKRAANDACSWSGHLAECRIASGSIDSVKVSTISNFSEALDVTLEKPTYFPERQKLVVCVSPLYIYVEWKFLVTAIETWIAMGASKIVIPIQSVSANAYNIIKKYEEQGIVIIRQHAKWPVLSDVNPNGLVLSRGIEESHVNCLHFVKPFADMVIFTDVDDVLLPLNPMNLNDGPLAIIEDLTKEHPQAGSFLLEHANTQFVLSENNVEPTLKNFNFDFLKNTQWTASCKVKRIPTRVIVNASRVDTVNMHETGNLRLGYLQVRVPCRKGHFYHLRHTFKNKAFGETRVDMSALAAKLNAQWKGRLENTFGELSSTALEKTSTESFKDFDRCTESIDAELWKLSASRCLTANVCFSRITRNVDCVALQSNYSFAKTGEDFVIGLNRSEFIKSKPNCEAPLPEYVSGNSYFLP